MNGHNGVPFRFALPLPAFVLHPLTALVIACVHVYLAAGHLSKLFGGEMTWTNIWKGFGALAGAYVFAALASRGLTRREGQRLSQDHQSVISSSSPSSCDSALP
jgi:hypothetical protein